MYNRINTCLDPLSSTTIQQNKIYT